MVNFWRPFIKCQYLNDGKTDFHWNLQFYWKQTDIHAVKIIIVQRLLILKF